MKAHEKFWEDKTVDPDDEEFLTKVPARFVKLCTTPPKDIDPSWDWY